MWPSTLSAWEWVRLAVLLLFFFNVLSLAWTTWKPKSRNTRKSLPSYKTGSSAAMDSRLPSAADLDRVQLDPYYAKLFGKDTHAR